MFKTSLLTAGESRILWTWHSIQTLHLPSQFLQCLHANDEHQNATLNIGVTIHCILLLLQLWYWLKSVDTFVCHWRKMNKYIHVWGLFLQTRSLYKRLREAWKDKDWCVTTKNVHTKNILHLFLWPLHTWWEFTCNELDRSLTARMWWELLTQSS